MSLCQKPVQTPLRLPEGATAQLSAASAFLPDSYHKDVEIGLIIISGSKLLAETVCDDRKKV